MEVKDGLIWVEAHEVKPGDVLAGGAEVLAATLISDSFVKITSEWGSHGTSMYPGKHQRVALRSVVTD